MTETLVDVSPCSKEAEPQPSVEELDAARELVRQARARGVALTGPDGLLKALTKTVIETALQEEMSEHLGYDKHDLAVSTALEVVSAGGVEGNLPVPGSLLVRRGGGLRWRVQAVHDGSAAL